MSRDLAAATAPPTTLHTASFDGTRIDYDLYDAPSEVAVIVVPGFWRDRSHPAMRRMATLLVAAGYRSAVVDVRGHGTSEGEYGFNLHEHHDVAAVARDLLAAGSTISSLALVGFSYGGAIAISTAARHDLPIRALLLISAVADFAMIAPRLNPLTLHRHLSLGQALHRPRFPWGARRAAKIRALDDVQQIRTPLCLIHVKDDWLISHRHSMALYEAANEPKELHLLDIEGCYHADRIFNVAAKRVEPIIESFLRRHLERPLPQQ